MTDPTKPQNAAQKNAQKYFTKVERSETLAKQARKKEHAVDAAKIAKLRGLRLAKEAVDKEDVVKQVAENLVMKDTERPARRKRAPIVRSVAMVRMTY